MPPPELTLARLWFRLRTEGLGWCRRRIACELLTPTTRVGRALRGGRHSLHRVVEAFRTPAGPSRQDDLVTAFFDLAVAPITFDVLWFIVGAELRRQRIGAAGVHFVIVPGHLDGLRAEYPEYEDVVDRDARRLRLINLIIPALAMLPTMCALTVAPNRAHAVALRRAAASVYPEDYEVPIPGFITPVEVMKAAAGSRCQVLEAPADARRRIKDWTARVAGRRRLVTVTLRDYAFGAGRNSDTTVWSAFARSLDPARWHVVFLVDTTRTLDAADPRLADFEVLHEASWNLPLRVALYETAWLNLGSSGGPMMCTLFSQSRALMFRLGVEEVEQAAEGYMRRMGFIPGTTPAIAPPFVRWVWERETLETVKAEFDAMVARIEASEPDLS